jgi:hypothetical protein
MNGESTAKKQMCEHTPGTRDEAANDPPAGKSCDFQQNAELEPRPSFATYAPSARVIREGLLLKAKECGHHDVHIGGKDERHR